MKKNIVLLSWVLASPFLFSLRSQEKTGLPYLTNYTVKDYEGYHQNWAVAEDQQGFIYVANNEGVLVYDASTWQMIRNPKRGTVRSLAVDRHNRVWVGAQSEFGWIERLPDGQMVFRSLEHKIPDASVKFDDIWRIHATDSMIYFRARKYIFCWDEKEMTILKDPYPFSGSYMVGDSLFIYQTDKGLSLLRGKKLEFISGSEFTKKKGIYFILHYRGDSLILGSQTDGLLIWYRNFYRPFHTEADSYLKEKKIYCATRSPDGKMFIGTLQGGVVGLHPNGKLLTSIGLAEGLNSEKIHALHLDREHGLWAAMDNGIARMSLLSPFSYWDNRLGIQGVVQDILLDGENVYAGTNLGFFELVLQNEKGRLPYYAFKKDPSLSTQVFNVRKFGHQFLIASREALIWSDGRMKKTLQKGTFFYLFQSPRDSSRVLVGAKNGVLVLQYANNQMKPLGMIKGIQTEIRSISETNDTVYWIGSRYAGVWSFRWNAANPTEPVLTHYDTTHGLPPGYILSYALNDTIVFCGSETVHYFHPLKQRFYPDTLFTPALNADPELPKSLGLSELFYRDGKIWGVLANRKLGYFIKSEGKMVFEYQPFQKIPRQTTINILKPHKNGVIWIGCNEGIIRYAPDNGYGYTTPFYTVIRSVKTIGNDSLIAFMNHQSPESICKLPYSSNHIRINYTALSYESESENQFRVFLDGYDHQWSAWTSERYKEYMNLSEGSYVFRVQGRNLYDHTSEESLFYFRILPPWYRTWWAYFLYSLTGVLFILGIVRWRVWIYAQRAQELEEKVRERTRELVAIQNQLIQSEKFSALGQLIGGIAHEINNPLSVAGGNLLYLGEYTRTGFAIIDEIKNQIKALPDDIRIPLQKAVDNIEKRYDLDYIREDMKQLTESSQHSVERIKKIIQDLRNLSGTDEQRRQPVLVRECVEQALLSLKHVYRPSVRIQKIYRDDQPVYCFQGLLTQALRHILLNAFQAIAGEGEIMIETQPMSQHREISHGEKPVMIIRITDTGCGIPEAVQGYIFDPFFTTKAVGDGTGLGLSIAYHFIKRHEGVIQFQSKPGKGTVFEIIIPAK